MKERSVKATAVKNVQSALPSNWSHKKCIVKLLHQRRNFPLIPLSEVILLLCLYTRCRLLGAPLEQDVEKSAYIGQSLLQRTILYLQA